MDNLYDFDTGMLHVRGRDIFVFDLRIRRHITQVIGFSGTGKTLLINTINEYKDNESFNLISSGLINVETFIKKVSLDALMNIDHSLIIIDDGDLFLNDDVVLRYIRMDRRNNYLIFARSGLNLGLSPNYYGQFVSDDSGKISLSYAFSEKGWF